MYIADHKVLNCIPVSEELLNIVYKNRPDQAVRMYNVFGKKKINNKKTSDKRSIMNE